MSNKFAFLEIYIGDLQKHKELKSQYNRAIEFLETHGQSYNLPTSITTLTEEEKETIQALYDSNPEFSSKGAILLTKPEPLPGGRITIELYSTMCPKTTENFLQICIGNNVSKSKKSLYYKGTKFFRVVKDYIVQGGDITRGDGTGGDSIYGGKFNDEKPGLKLKFYAKGLLGMANSGKNSNTSQIFFTLTDDKKCLERLDGKCECAKLAFLILKYSIANFFFFFSSRCAFWKSY